MYFGARLLEQSVYYPRSYRQSGKLHLRKQRQGLRRQRRLCRDAIRVRLERLKNDNEYVEVSREQYNELEEALKEMGTTYRSQEQFIRNQISEVPYKYDEFKRERKSGI